MTSSSPLTLKKVISGILWAVAAIMIVLMIYSMVSGPGNYYYGAIALVIALVVKAAEKLDS